MSTATTQYTISPQASPLLGNSLALSYWLLAQKNFLQATPLDPTEDRVCYRLPTTHLYRGLALPHKEYYSKVSSLKKGSNQFGRGWYAHSLGTT